MKLRRYTLALVGVAAWATVILMGGASVADASSAPVVHVSTRYAVVGQLVQVTGSGWSPVGQTVSIQLCGQDARNLSNDCDQADQYTAAIRSGGIFYGALTVGLPPSPCPCVVVVTNQGGFSGVNVPISIAGARNVPVPPEAAPKAPVALSAKVDAPFSLSSLFGGPKPVTLVLRVKNVSSITYESPTLSVNVGRGRNPSGFVVAKPLAPLPVGATQVLRIPVTVPAFTFGTYTVRAQVITGQGQVAAVEGTSSYPWALFVLAALAIQAVLLLIRNRVRSRLGRPIEAEGPVEEPATEGADEPVSVIDLRTPARPPADAWTTTHRMALLLPDQNLTCRVEVLACPAISIQKTTVRVWTDFAASPWDALHEGTLWSQTSAESPSNALVPEETFHYGSRDLDLDLHLTASGGELRLGENRTMVPVRVHGSVSLGDDIWPVDVESALEQSWDVEPPSDGTYSEEARPRAGSLTYGHAPGGESFYLRFDSDGEPAGWLTREDLTATIVHAERRVEERSGPYPRRITVELSDDLGRRAVAGGTACNGMTFRDDDGLVMECRTEWDLDGVAAVGEDRSRIDLDAWRRIAQAGRGELADTPS